MRTVVPERSSTSLSPVSLPEALLCFNDHCAVGALMELRRQGVRVPQDVAVTGYDGIPVTAATAFSLTTVRQNAGLIAEVAVRALLARMHPDHGGQIPVGVAGADRRLGGHLYRVVPEPRCSRHDGPRRMNVGTVPVRYAVRGVR